VSEPNGWQEWSKYVLRELERLSAEQTSMRRELEAIRVDLATLKTKAGVWGAASGAVPAAIALLWMLLNRAT
jgi:hypothetical protein